MAQFCDECLSEIMINLTQEDIMMLEYLEKEKTRSPILAVDKTKIIPNIKGFTDFRFQMAISRLELACLVGRNNKKRPNKFYITKSGRRALELFKESVSAQ